MQIQFLSPVASHGQHCEMLLFLEQVMPHSRILMTSPEVGVKPLGMVFLKRLGGFSFIKSRDQMRSGCLQFFRSGCPN